MPAPTEIKQPTVAMPLAFPVPDVLPNDDGWGPGASSIPAHLVDMPFAPFGKGDKIGRASDWTQAAYQKFQGEQSLHDGLAAADPMLLFWAGCTDRCVLVPSGRFGQGQPTAVFNFFHNEEVGSSMLHACFS